MAHASLGHCIKGGYAQGWVSMANDFNCAISWIGTFEEFGWPYPSKSSNENLGRPESCGPHLHRKSRNPPHKTEGTVFQLSSQTWCGLWHLGSTSRFEVLKIGPRQMPMLMQRKNLMDRSVLQNFGLRFVDAVSFLRLGRLEKGLSKEQLRVSFVAGPPRWPC